MKYGKRLLALVLALGMVVTMLPENTYAEIASEAAQTTEIESTGAEAGSTELSTEAATETTKASTEVTTETEKASTEATTETEQASTEVATETEKASTEATTETEKASTEATTEQPTTAGLTSGGVTATYQEIALGEEQTVYGNGRDNKFLYTPEEAGWYRMDTEGSDYQDLTLYAYDVSTGLTYQESISYYLTDSGTRALFMYLEADKHYVMSYYSNSSARSVLTLNKLQTITGISIDTQPPTVNELSETYRDYDLSGTFIKLTYEDGTNDIFKNRDCKSLIFAGISAPLSFQYGNESGLDWNTVMQKLTSDITSGTASASGTIGASAALQQSDVYANAITGLQLNYNYVNVVALTKAEVVTAPTRTTYYHNSKIDLNFSGMDLRLTYADGHTIDLSKPGSCSTGQYRYSFSTFGGFDTSVVGTQTITINCDSDSSKNATFPISVLDNPYDTMRIVTEPNKTTYCDYANGGADYTGLTFELSNSTDSSVPTKTISYVSGKGMLDDTYGEYDVLYDGSNRFDYLAGSKDPYTATVSLMGLTAKYQIYVKPMADLAAEGGELTQAQPVTYVSDCKGSSYQTYYSFKAFGTDGEKTDYKFAMSTDAAANLSNTYLNIYYYNPDTAQYTTVYSRYAGSSQMVELTAGKTYYIGLWSNGSKGHTYTLSASLQPELDKFEITSKKTQFLDGFDDIDYSDIINGLQVKMTYGDTTENCTLGNISSTASIQEDGTEKLVFNNGFTLTYDGDHSQYLTAGSYQVTLSYGTMSETYAITVQDVKTVAEQLTLDTPTTMTATGNSSEIHPYVFTPTETGYYTITRASTGTSMPISDSIHLYNSNLVQILYSEYAADSMTAKLEANQTYYFGITCSGSAGSACTVTLQKQKTLQAIQASFYRGVIIPELNESDLYSLVNSMIVSYVDDQNNTKRLMGGFSYNGGKYNTDGSVTYVSSNGVQLILPSTSLKTEGTYSVKVSCLGAETTCDIPIVSLKNYSNPLTLDTQKSVPNGYNGVEYDTFIPTETGYYQLNRTGDYGFLMVYDESAATICSESASNVVVRLEQGKKYIIQNAYYQTSSENTIALSKLNVTSIGTAGITDNFTQQTQLDYYSFTPQDSGYYILNESVTSGVQDEDDMWNRRVNVTLYDDTFQSLVSASDSYTGSKNAKFVCGYLESGKTYYLGVASQYSIGGSISFTLDKQKEVKSISVAADTVTGVAGTSLSSLVKKLTFNVSYSDGTTATLDMKNIISSGYGMADNTSFFYVKSDTGITVQFDSNDGYSMSKGTYPLTVTCQDASCTISAQIKSPADAAEEIIDNTMNVVSTGDEEECHYYKLTPSDSGYYKVTIQDTAEDMDQSIRIYRDETMTSGTYCSNGTLVKLEAGKTVYFCVSDYYSSGHSYSIKLTSQAVTAMGTDNCTVDFTTKQQYDYFSFTPAENGYYILNEAITAGADSEEGSWGRNVNLSINDSDMGRLNSSSTYYTTSSSKKALYAYLESDKTYIISAISQGSTGGSMALSLEKQKTVQSITPSVESIKGVVGTSFRSLVRNLQWQVTYSDDSTETLDMKNITSSGTMSGPDDEDACTYATNDTGVTVKMQGEDEYSLPIGDYTLTATCQDVSCTVVAHIVSPADAAEEITDTMTVESTGNEEDCHYYKWTPSDSGYYKVTIQDEDVDASVEMYQDSLMTTGTYCSNGSLIKTEAGKMLYFKVSDYCVAGVTYFVKLTKQDVTDISTKGGTADFTQASQSDYFSFTPAESGYYQLNESVTAGTVSGYNSWYRYLNLCLYNSDMMSIDTSSAQFNATGSKKAFYDYLESGKTYIIRVNSNNSIGGSMTVSFVKQKTITSIVPTVDTIKGVIGTSFEKLVKNLQWTVTYSDGSSETLDMKNITRTGIMSGPDDGEYTYVTSDTGVTVKMQGYVEDDLAAGSYTLTATCQDASCTMTATIVSAAEVATEIVNNTVTVTPTGNSDDYHYYKWTPAVSGYYKLTASYGLTSGRSVQYYTDSAMTKGTDWGNNAVVHLEAGNIIYFKVCDGYSSSTTAYTIQLTPVEAPVSVQVTSLPVVGIAGINANALNIRQGLTLKASYADGGSKDFTISLQKLVKNEDESACTITCNDGIELSLKTSSPYSLAAGTYQIAVSMLGASTSFDYHVKTVAEAATSYTCGASETYTFGNLPYRVLSVTPSKTDTYTFSYGGPATGTAGNTIYYGCNMVNDQGSQLQYYQTGAKVSLQAGTTYYFSLYLSDTSASMNFCMEGSKSLFDTVTVSTPPTDTAYSVLDTEYKLSGLGLTCNYSGTSGKTFAITSDMLTGITSSNHTVEVQDTEGNKVPVTIAFKKVSAADFTGAIHPVAGSNALVITVDGIQKEVPITVAESPLTDMKLASANTTYEYGNTTNMLSDVSLQMNYNGTNKTVTIADLQKNIANSSYDAGYGAYPIQLQVPDDINSAGDKVFTVSYMGKEATLTVTVKKQTVSAITITDIDAPVLDGTPDTAVTVPEDAGYSVLGIQWKDDDGKVVADGSKFDGAKRYTAYVTVKANDSDHKFTTSTNATVNGCNVLSKTSNQNGTYTLAYRFGYTACKVTLPQSTTGITNVSGNTSVTYKGDYTFTVTIDPSYSIAGATVKANDQILKASSVNTNTYTYTLTKVFQNQNITIKDLKENTAGINVRFYSDENKTTLADQYAVNIGSSVSANAEPDDKVPNLGTYTDADGKEMMFYGWYRDIADASTRIKSNTTITLNMATTTDGKNYLDLLPKYIQQTFRYEYNGLYVVYKIISISESGKVKLQLYNTNMKEVSATVAAKAASHIPGMCIKAAGTGDTLTLQSFQYDGLGAGETVDCDITEVSANAFAGASAIKAISLPNTVETIEAGAFAGCTSLESVVIPQSVTSLEENTFSGCTSLTDVVLPDSLETIDSSAFAGTNSGLTITCSSSVKALASSAATGAEFQNVDISFTDYDYSTMDLQYSDSQSVTTAIQVNGASIDSSDWSGVTATSSDPDTVKVVKSNSGIAITACGVSEDAVTVTVAYKSVTKTLAITTAKKSIAPPSYITSLMYTGKEQDCVLGDEGAYTITGNKATNAGSYTATITPAENYQWEDGTTTTSTISWSIAKAQLPANAYNVPTGLTAKPGQKLGDISLPTGFKWDDEQESVGAAGTNTFTATYTDANTNYYPATGIAIKVTVASPTVSVTGVTLNQSSMEIAKGKTAVLNATVAPSNATNQNLTWSSSNTGVATVAADGTVTAKANGSAVITVATADGNKTAACTVNVVTPAAKVITTASASIVKGKTLSLSATMTPSDTTDKITWSSSNPKVATVSTSGKVSAKGIGSATITATATSGKKATCKITVVKNKVAATSIKLNKSKSTIKAGETLALTAKLSPNKTTDTVTWSTSSKKIATVDKNGIVTGIKGGTVTITGKTTNGLTATCKVTVKVPSTSVSINKTAATIKVKKTIKLKATMNPKGSTDSLTWSSSNKKCATVSKDGTVKGLKKGTVTITVKTSSGKKATCKITIK